MTIRGDMEAYCHSKLGITMTQAKEVIDCALEAADCYDFATKYQQKVEVASGLEDYFDVVRFLRDLLK